MVIGGKELETREKYIQLADACLFLEDYQLDYASSPVSLFRGKGGRPDIYLVESPGWKDKFRKLLEGGGAIGRERRGYAHRR